MKSQEQLFELQSDHGLDVSQLKRNKKIIDQEIQLLNKGMNFNDFDLADQLSKSPVGRRLSTAKGSKRNTSNLHRLSSSPGKKLENPKLLEIGWAPNL